MYLILISASLDYLPSNYIKNIKDILKVGTNDEEFEFIDRSDEIKEVESYLKRLQSIPNYKRTNKSNNFFMVIHGSSGSGKSRFIDELSQVINDENSLIIPITYTLSMADDSSSVDTIIDRFHYRILYS